jgi:hypothetical protein
MTPVIWSTVSLVYLIAPYVLIIILAVDPWLHTAMDKYAMFAVTCSHKFLDMYIDIIKTQNEIWVAHHEAGDSYVRKLKVR